MDKSFRNTYPAEKPTENRQEDHSFSAMSAGDIYGMAAKMGREGVSPFCFVMFGASTARSDLDWAVYFIPNLLKSINQEDTYTVRAAATAASKLITVEIGS